MVILSLWFFNVQLRVLLNALGGREALLDKQFCYQPLRLQEEFYLQCNHDNVILLVLSSHKGKLVCGNVA